MAVVVRMVVAKASSSSSSSSLGGGIFLQGIEEEVVVEFSSDDNDDMLRDWRWIVVVVVCVCVCVCVCIYIPSSYQVGSECVIYGLVIVIVTRRHKYPNDHSLFLSLSLSLVHTLLFGRTVPTID